MVALGEKPPDGARVRRDRAAVTARDAEILQRDALAVEHAEDVMVRHHEQPRRIGERLVLGVPARIGVAVRGDDRQGLDVVVEAPRHGAGGRIGRKKPVLVNQHGVSRSTKPAGRPTLGEG